MSRVAILFIDLAPHAGGSVISMTHLIRGLDKKRWRPMVVLSRQNHFPELEELGIPVARVRTPQREEQHGDLIDVVRQGKTGDFFRSLPGASKLWHGGGIARYWHRDIIPVVNELLPIIHDFQPSLVHLNDSLALVRHGFVASWRARVPALVHSRSLVPLSFYDRRLFTPRVSGMIFISRAVAQHQLQEVGAPPPHRIIPNPVDFARFQKPVDRFAIRRELGVAPTTPLIGMIGRIAPWKGQSIFVEAFAQLHWERPDAVAIIVGETDTLAGDRYREEIKERILELGLRDRILWLGHRQDIPDIMSSLDVLAHCSVTPEPFGRVIIEGMAAGTPVIASAAGGAAEIVEHGVDGLLTPPGDATALAAAMAKLLSDESLREKLKANGQKKVRDQYTVETHVAAVTSFYESLLRTQI